MKELPFKGLYFFRMLFVVEHLEEELFPWCLVEYRRIQECVGFENFIVSNLSVQNGQSFQGDPRSILEMGIPFGRICLLDSESSLELTPEDKNQFDVFLLGGILGNVDEFDMDRTAILRRHGFPTRNLGHMQMTTDTAVKTSFIILSQQKKLEEIEFIDRPDLAGPSGQQFVSDFRYLTLPDGSPDIDPLILKEMEQDFDLEFLE
jgi:ribosome biogenesis SPOUT family RNA methylase Rps3